MEQDRIRTLLEKYQDGSINDEERAFLENWYAMYREPQSDEYEEEQAVEDSITVIRHLQRRVLPPRKRKYLIPAAAAAVVAVAFSVYYYRIQPVYETSPQTETHSIILPGGNQASLILPDGKTIDLNNKKEGIVFEAGKVAYQDGTLIEDSSYTGASALTNHAILSTPKGGQYQIRLPDGTRVWLNAYSSLSYPVSFEGLKERRVELRGEAYFEVAPNKEQPFTVATERQIMEVLGTHFNINSYTEAPEVITTLLEGSLRITTVSDETGKTSKSTVLVPGQQAILSTVGTRITEVDTTDAIAWKNGYFQFINKDLETAMLELARWYDVEVEYEDDTLRKRKLAGTISKYTDIAKVLEKIELTGAAHFRITGRRVLLY